MIRAVAGDGGDGDDGGLRDPQLSIQRIIYEQSVSRPSSYDHTRYPAEGAVPTGATDNEAVRSAGARCLCIA